MTDCVNHSGRASATDCDGCSRPFCDGCLVRFEKLAVCASCKARYLTGVDEAPVPRRAAAAPPGPGGIRGAPGENANARARTRATAGRGTLYWMGGGTALLFSGAFLFVIVASLAEPFRVWTRDRRLVETHEQLASVGAALERFRTDSGEYPERLSELVPSYLSRLPKDPYGTSGAPPRYDRRRLWSLGPDGTDDRGQHPADIVYLVD